MRLFVALDLPDEVRASLSGWALQTVGADERLRLVGEEKLHATLVFLGARDDDTVPDIAATVVGAFGSEAVAPPLRVDGALWLSPRWPHVLTVALADPSGGLARIQAAVLDALVREAGHEAERRAFRPHVTVARVRGRIRPFELGAPPALEFAPPAVTLYRSVLNTSPPVPASYEALASVPLSTLP
jgi:RNA 2',3'-cyclic 3'-phosphodiesterase